jgi:hypothetical protein
VQLTILWPDNASALEDFAFQVSLPGMAERDPGAVVTARLTDPLGEIWWESGLYPVDQELYQADSILHLPLDPPPGDWRLTIFIDAQVPVNGGRTIFVQPAPVLLRGLGEQVPQGISLLVPRSFTAIRHEGDQISGVRVWSMLDGEVGLWWLPGPAEPLSLDTASVMLAASHPEDANVEILSLQTLEWGDLSGFRFVEDWFEGPAEALLVQGPDRWLYLVRVRALDDGEISPLLRDIQASFGLTE